MHSCPDSCSEPFYVYGQFTRYLRPGCQLIGIDEPNSIAAYDRGSHKLVIVKVTGEAPEIGKLDMSSFSVVSDTVQLIGTTTPPGASTPDWQQPTAIIKTDNQGDQKLVNA